MDQKEIRKILGRYLDDEITGEKRNEIAEKIKNDPEWHQEYNRLLSLQSMAEKFEIEADESFWEQSREDILDRIDTGERRDAEITDINRRGKRGAIIKMLAVAASIALVAFISIYEFESVEPKQELFTEPQIRVKNRNVDLPETISKEDRMEMERKDSAPSPPAPKMIPDRVISNNIDAVHKPEILGESQNVIRELPEVDKSGPAKRETKIPVNIELPKENSIIKKKPPKTLPKGKMAAVPESIDDIDLSYDQDGRRTKNENIAEPSIEMQSIDALSAADIKPGNMINFDSLEDSYHSMMSIHLPEIAAKRRETRTSGMTTSSIKDEEAGETSAVAEAEREILDLAEGYFRAAHLEQEKPNLPLIIERLSQLGAISSDKAVRDSVMTLADSLRKLTN